MKQELAAFDDADIQAMVVEHHRERIRKLVDQIIRERERILLMPEEVAKVATQREKPRLSAVEIKEIQIEKLRKRHQPDVEQMLATLMALAQKAMHRKRDATTTDAVITETLRKQHGILEKRAEDARLQRSDRAFRGIQRTAQWKARQEELSIEMQRSETEKQRHIQEVLA
jgi:predicted nucleic acid-binding protein